MIAYWERDSEWMGDGLVGAWCPSFTGATGLQLADISGQANHGVLTNMDPGTDWVASGSGLALDFDGSNDGVSASSFNMNLLDNAINSVSLWINPTTTNTISRPLSCGSAGSNLALRYNFENLEFTFGGTSVLSVSMTNAAYAGKWTHVCGVSSSSGAILYFNGIQVGSRNDTVSLTKTTGLGIGYRFGVNSDYFTGQLDDVRIWNRALTPSEVNLIYTGGRGAGMLREPPRRRSFQGVTIPRPSSNPVRRKPRKNNTLLNGLVGAWCPSLGANGTRLLDVSGRNNHGVLTNMDANSDYIPSGGKLALDFDGVNDRVLISDSQALRLTVQSACVWFRCGDQGAASRSIYQSYSQDTNVAGFAIGINVFNQAVSQNRLSCVIGKNTGVNAVDYGLWYSTATVADSNWHFGVVIVNPNGSVSFFVDGLSVNSTLFLGNNMLPVYSNLNQVAIGVEKINSGSNGKHWNGQLDDIRIYNRPLTATEVRQLYQGGRGYGLKQQRIKVGYTDPSPNLNKISIRKPKKKNTLTTGLVGAWCPSLGPTGTRLRDVSGRNNDGVLTNMDPNTDWVASGGKGALDFDGVNDFVLANPLSVFIGTAQDFTFSFWHNPANISTTVDLVAQHQVTGSAVGRQNANIRFRNGGQTLLSNASLVVGKWVHVAASRLGSTTRLYIDGFLDNSGSPGTTINSNGLFIGGNSSGQYGAGQLDDIRIYNRALTPQEINQLYVGGRGYGLTPAKRTTSKKTIYVDAPVPAKPKPAVDTSKLKQGLVGAWIPSLGPTGLRLEDKSPYKNHGTLTNMSNSNWVVDQYHALNCTGSAASVRMQNTPELNITSYVTVAAWVKYNQGQGNRGIVAKSGDTSQYHLRTASTDNRALAFTVNSSGGISSVETTKIYNDNAWHLAVGIYNRANIIINIDGGKEITVGPSVSGDLVVNPLPVFIGCYTNNGGSFIGLVDDIRIWNRALTNQEIKALYLGGRGYGFRPQRTRYILGTASVLSTNRRRRLICGANC